MHRYNIVLLTVDSWNRNFIGSYDQDAKTQNITPNLDKWSTDSVVFSSAFSPSVKTSASFPSILSGCYPCKYGDWFASVSDARLLISQILHDTGYFTYGFTSNPCTSSLRGYHKGFDVFRDDNVLKTTKSLNLTIKLAFKTMLQNPYSSADQINSQVLSLLEKQKSPYFLWIHYMDVHGPYIPMSGNQFKNRILATRLWKKAIAKPSEITHQQRKKLIDAYKNNIRLLDYHIFTLIEQLHDNDTIVILTSDHGDVFGDRGYFGHPFIFYNEMINVPLFMKFPPEMKISNCSLSQPVSLLDIVPTIVDILGLEIENEFDGHSLLPLLQGRDHEYQTKNIISEISREYVCAIRGKWKFIANYAESSFELYNLEEDYAETYNVIGQRADVREKLESVVKNHIMKHRLDR